MIAPELEPLAKWIAGFDISTADEHLTGRLFATMADWSSALFAGTGHPLFTRYTDALLPQDETGPLRVVGCRGRYPRASAAMAHAAISHFWEVDDAHRESTSHPGITVIPAVMAVAEARNLDAGRTAGAIVAGFETILRIGSHLGTRHYAVNHTTATAGAFGAAAGVAHAIGLDAEKTLWAFGHAGTQAAGLWQFLDEKMTDAKAFHPAIAVRNGLAAASMAEAGIPGARRSLEGPRGMRRAWHLDDCDPDLLVPGDQPLIHSVTIKGWPVCGQMHSALDCARALADAHPRIGENTQSVVVELPATALSIAGVGGPATVTEAKFSTTFCIAAVLRGKAPDFSGLTEELLQDSTIHKLANCVTLREEPSFTARFPKERPARVTVQTPDGKSVSEERAFRKGDPESPWSRAELEQRTADILSIARIAPPVEALIAWCDRFASRDRGWNAAALHDLADAGKREVA